MDIDDFQAKITSGPPVMFTKEQICLIKELIEVGVTSICTHVCASCFYKPLSLWSNGRPYS